MIVDTSALVAILYDEPVGDAMLSLIFEAPVCRFSAANFVELFMVMESGRGPRAARLAEDLLGSAGILIEPVTAEQAEIARQAFLDFGKGRHPARLNFGDCFAYALARAMDEPLLFKGDDFALTDIAPAI